MRKRRKVTYAGDDGDCGDDADFASEDRPPLAERDVNKYPVYKVKDKNATFRQRFSVPLIDKKVDSYNACRPAPALGMRRCATFVAKPLHDPSGEFAIVLYDPTVDDATVKAQEAQKPENDSSVTKVDEPLMHKSLADILGLKKKVEDRPRVPVVIDPRLAKVLRPHQVEGVKVGGNSLPIVTLAHMDCAVLVSLYDGLD